MFGLVRPGIVVEEPGGLRTQPTLRETDETHTALTSELAVRIWWTRHTGTIVSAGWSGEASRQFTFPKPERLSPPFTHYEAERTVTHRSRFLSIAQERNLVSAGSVLPFVAAGLEIRSVVNRQTTGSVGFVDATSRLSSSQERTGTQIALLVGAGLRVLVGSRGVVSGDAAIFATRASMPLGEFSARWRVGAGVRF